MKRGKGKRVADSHRITTEVAAAVVKELSAWAGGSRRQKLTWKAIEEFSGFSKPALWANPKVKAAFQEAKVALRRKKIPPVKPPRTIDARIEGLEGEITRLREVENRYRELWDRYEYNAQRLGIDPDELRKPLEPPSRVNLKKPGPRRSGRWS